MNHVYYHHGHFTLDCERVCTEFDCIAQDPTSSLGTLTKAINAVSDKIAKMRAENSLSDSGFKRLMNYVSGLRHDLECGVELDVDVVRLTGFKNIFRSVEISSFGDGIEYHQRLSSGADQGALRGVDATPAIEEACKRQCITQSQLVNASGASDNVLFTQAWGAEKEGADSFLLQAGADPNYYGILKETIYQNIYRSSGLSLFAAFRNRKSDIDMANRQIVRLLAYGADPNIMHRLSDTFDSTSNSLAFLLDYERADVAMKQVKLFPTLVAGGLNINAKAWHRATWLTCVCTRPSDAVTTLAIKTLVYLGAEITDSVREAAAKTSNTRELARAEELRRNTVGDKDGAYPVSEGMEENEEAFNNLFSWVNPFCPKAVFPIIVQYAGVCSTVVRANYDACMAIDASQQLQRSESALLNCITRIVSLFRF